MRAFLTAAVMLIVIAAGANFILRDDARSASSAFATSAVRLDPINVTNNLGRMPPHVEQK